MADHGQLGDVPDAKHPPRGSAPVQIPDPVPSTESSTAVPRDPVRPPGASTTESNLYSRFYEIASPLKGRALIINNSKFHGKPHPQLRDRTFSMDDVNTLDVALKQLDFESKDIVIKKDLSADDMLKELKEEAKRKELEEIDLFICVILSHGEENSVYGADKKLVPMERMTSCFSAKKCPQLAMKPKVFIVQACHEPKGMEQSDSISDMQTDLPKKKGSVRIPSEADFLVLYSSVPGSWATKHQSGSWFVTAVKDMLNKHGRKTDLLSLFTKVIKEVSKKMEEHMKQEFEARKKQVPYITTTLMKEIRLPKPS